MMAPGEWVKSNVVIIMTDEQSLASVGAYGNPLARTPALDDLASRSCVFERAYVTQPVCTASRSSLLTGLYPHTNGCTENNIPLDPSIRTLPELAGAPNGYEWGYIGKWHLGDEIFRQHGFSEWRSIEDGYREYYREGLDRTKRSDYDAFLRANGYEPDLDTDDGVGVFSRPFAARLPEELTKASFVGSESVDFIKRHAGSPFVLFSAFLEPHMPFFGPRDTQYADVEIPLPVSYDDPLQDKPLKTRLFARAYSERGHSGVDLASAEGMRELTRRYWGLASMVDYQVGRIVQAIMEAGVADRTVIVFTSDHGEMMGAHGLVGKCVMFEEAVRVPLLVSFPPGSSGSDRPSPGRYPYPVSQIDLVPTLLDILGAAPGDGLEGRSLLGRMCDPPPTPEEAEDVVIEWNGMNNGFGDVVGDTEILSEWRELADDLTIKAALDDPVRTVVCPDGRKYTWSHRGEDTLFDVHRDPAELVNLAGSTTRAEIRDLRSRIEAWQARTLDAVVYG